MATGAGTHRVLGGAVSELALARATTPGSAVAHNIAAIRQLLLTAFRL